MKDTEAPPLALQAKFFPLARRIRIARLLRGVISLSVLAAGLLLAGFLIDSTVGWSVPYLRIFSIGVGAALMLACLGTTYAGMRSLPSTHLTALVERRFPELGERLISSVELHESAEPGHGAPELIHRLGEETVERTASLNFAQAYSIRTTVKLSIAALGLVLVTLAALGVSESYARFARRLLVAWSPSVYGYEIHVEPGNHFTARGRSAAVTARIRATEAGVRMPSKCWLVCDSSGKRVRLAMEALDGDSFGHTWPALQESLTYRVEAGDVVSPEYRLEAIDPVALLPGSPKIQVTLPPYARADVVRPLEQSGDVPFRALQYSRLQFSVEFDRPARKAAVRWRGNDQERMIPLPLAEDYRSASWNTLAVDLGPHAATLILEAEHGIVSTFALPAWSVWSDDAPRFTIAPALGAGRGDQATLVAPDDIIPIQALVKDEVGFGKVVLEYAVNDGPPRLFDLGAAEGPTSLLVQTSWPLRGLVKVGDTIKCRLRANDNRRLHKGELQVEGPTAPDRDLEPNVTYHPAREGTEDRWGYFRVDGKAEPLAQQAILRQRHEMSELIESIKRKLDEEAQQLKKLREGSHQQPILSAEQRGGLASLHKSNEQVRQDLLELAGKATEVPGLTELARLGHDVATRELAESDRALAAAQARNLQANQREQELHKAEQAVQAARKRLDALAKLNESLAQERLDVHELEKLAQHEAELAQQARELADQPGELDRLRNEQSQIAARMDKLAEKNPHLREAMQQARRAQAQALAKRADSLAMRQRELSDKAEAQWQAAAKDKFKDLAQQQRLLAEKIGSLDRELQAQIETRALKAPHRPAREAADQLQAGQAELALANQQVTEDALEALARATDKTLAQGRDARAAADKLAKQQEQLHKQLAQLGEDFPRLLPEQVRARLDKIVQGQKALDEALDKMDVAAADEAGRRAVQGLASAALTLLKRKDTLAAFSKMEEARDAFRAWARSLPEAPATVGKERPDEARVKAHAKQGRRLAQEQRELREATRKLLSLLAKKHGNSREQALHQEDVDKLTQDLMKLSQQSGPEAKQALQHAAQAAQMAQKAMAKSQTEKQEGRAAAAMKEDAEAALQLEMAGKKVQEAAASMASPAAKSAVKDDGDLALQKSFQDSAMKLDAAQQAIQTQPAKASAAMQQAAQSLMQTARQAQARLAARPASKGGQEPARGYQGGAASPAAEILAEHLKAHSGKAWGDLPGELRTRIVQDLRARYGDEYGPIIQRYFQQIADVPDKRNKK